MLKKQLLLSLLLISSFAYSQNRKVIIVNGGVFGTPDNVVKIGVYNPTFPSQLAYSVVDTIKGSSGTGLSIYKGNFLVSTNDKLTLYNASTNERMAQLRNLSGVRGTCWVNDSIVCAAFGYGTPTNESTVRFYKVTTNSFTEMSRLNGLTTLADYPVAVPGMVVVGLLGSYTDTTASMIAIQTGFLTLEPYIAAMGTRGVGYQNPLVVGNRIVSVNTGPYSSDTSQIMTWDYQSLSMSTQFTKLNFGTSKTLGAKQDSLVIHKTSNESGIYKINISNGGLSRVVTPVTQIASGVYDDATNEYFFTSPNYSSNAKLYQYREVTGALDSIIIGASPEQIGIWSDHYLAVEEAKPTASMVLSPNPTSKGFNITTTGKLIQEVQMIASSGQITRFNVVNNYVNTDRIAPGLYVVSVPNSGIIPQRIVIK